MENIKQTLQTLKDDISELKKLYSGEDSQIARLEKMEKVIADFENKPEKKYVSKNAEDDFKKSVENFNKGN